MRLTADQIQLLDHWQALTAGLIALAAALIGSAFVCGQIIQSHLQNQNKTNRRLRSARALSPLAISALCEYATACVSVLRPIGLFEIKSGSVPILPDVPLGITPQLEKLIEASPKRPALAVAAVLRKLQVQSARARGFLSEVASEKFSKDGIRMRVDGEILDAVEVYALAARLFDYARGESNYCKLGQLTLSEMTSALFTCRIYDVNFAEIAPNLNRRYPNSPPTLLERWRAYPSVRAFLSNLLTPH